MGHSQLTLEEKVDVLYEVSPRIPASEMVEELSGFIEKLHKYDKLSDKKRIKKIFADTKSEYLKRYSLYAFFSDIKIHDTYNCVTGSALFAIIFEELGIPYKVVEIPRHVYLIAYPGTLDYGIESTVTEEGVYNWTENNKSQAINFLIQSGEVKESEVRFKGVDAVLNEFFYTDIQEGFESLVGMQFFNYALLMSEQNNYPEALHYLERSESYGENQRSKMIKGAVLGTLIDETEIENTKLPEYLVRYYTILEKKSHKQRTLANFNYVTSEALVNRKDEAYLDSAENTIFRFLSDEEEQDLFLSCLDRAKAVWHYNRRQGEKALFYAKKGYERNPENKEFEDLIGSLIVPEVFSLFTAETFGIAFLDSLDSYEQRYPFLLETPEYINDVTMTYSNLVSSAYFYGDFEVIEMNRCLERLEKLSHHPDLDKREVYPQIGKAYGDISTYYFREKEYDEALKWINLALEFDAGSEALQRKKGYIEEKM